MSNGGGTVDFTVVPTEDLYLSHGTKRRKRVSKGTLYPCQMQKNQTFSCLFRHYAKHNGLDKDSLVFTFLGELEGDQLPESVHLLSGDEIFVAHRRGGPFLDEPQASQASQQQLMLHMEAMMRDSTCWDVSFVFVNEGGAEVGANKCVLCNRSPYFSAMFRGCPMLESVQNRVEVVNYSQSTFLAMLEYMYTGRVRSLARMDLSQCSSLMLLANEYGLEDLNEQCQHAAGRLLSPDSLSRMFMLGEDTNGAILLSYVKNYIEQNLSSLRADETFRRDLETVPRMALAAFDSVAGGGSSWLLPGGGGGAASGGSKRRRLSGSTPTATANASSSSSSSSATSPASALSQHASVPMSAGYASAVIGLNGSEFLHQQQHHMIGALVRDDSLDSVSSQSIPRPLNTSVLSPWHLSGDLANLVASARLAVAAAGDAPRDDPRDNPRERVRAWAAELEAEEEAGERMRESTESSSA